MDILFSTVTPPKWSLLIRKLKITHPYPNMNSITSMGQYFTGTLQPSLSHILRLAISLSTPHMTHSHVKSR